MKSNLKLKQKHSLIALLRFLLPASLLVVQQSNAVEIHLPANDPQCQSIPLPSLSELSDFKDIRSRYDLQRYEGMTIGKTSIVTMPIFNEYDPAESYSLYRFINGLHSPTMNYVIERQLLFKEGDVLEVRIIEESERILRENNYLADAVVLPHQICGGKLHLVVISRDLWTLMPKLFFSRKGGYNKYGLTLEDENILGTGDTLFLDFIHDRERDTTAVGYRTKHVFGSRVELRATYSDTTDGAIKELEVIRPFYSLDANWSVGLTVNENIFKESLEAFNQDIDTFYHVENKYEVSTGYSRGVQKGFTQRYTFGFTRKLDLFEPVDDTPVTLPADRILAYPWIQYSLIEDNFVIYHNLNALHRIEDVPVGVELNALVGYADKEFHSELSQWVFEFRYDDTPVAFDRHIVKSRLELNGFRDRTTRDYVNTISTLELTYYGLLAEMQRAFIRVAYDYGYNLSQDQLLTLGGEEGLRGYAPEFLLGDQRLLVNMEFRHFFDLHYLHLFRFASVIFFDLGQTKNSNSAYGENSDLLTSAGIGMRINSSKTNINRIVHLDLAFPLNEKDQVDKYEIRITSSSTF